MKKTIYILSIFFMPIFVLAQKSNSKSNLSAPTSWLLTGNIGITDTSNFLGTQDAHPLVFRVNKRKAGYIDFDSSKANTGFGYKSLSNNAGYNNSAYGYQALLQNVNGVNNTAIGMNALYSNTFGQANTALGGMTLYNNKSGNFNTAVGLDALISNVSGSTNTAIGQAALAQNKRGSDNTANGYLTLYFNTASKNTATGSNALYDNTTGNSNTATGELSLYRSSTGNYNTASGSGALFNNISGSNNTGDGVGALSVNLSGSYNTALGANANVTADNFSNVTVIGYGALVDASNKVVIGNGAVTSIGGQVGWTNYSDGRIKKDIKENVPGLIFIKALRPVTYHFNIDKENELSGNKNTVENNDIDKTSFTGLMAQEVEAAAKKVGYDFSGVDKTGKILGLRYSEFVVPLVKAVQELSNKNDSLQQQLANMQKRLEALEAATAISGNQNLQVASIGNTAGIDQNAPNPFTNSTSIGYHLPQHKSSAYINIYTLNGTLIKSIKLSGTGKGLVTLQSSDFTSGAYQYTLLLDGKIVDKKQFIKE
ncbi:MAG: tail fiber domain-containing protein [Panacibacter sp.]